MISNEKNNSKSYMNIIATIAIVLYVISAIAFEYTPETARISTLGIYLVFVLGVIYILRANRIVINVYDFCLLLMVSWSIIMMFPMGDSSVSKDVAYWLLTCSILCFIVKFIVYKNVNIVNWILWASIIGALILTIRIIDIYGGIAAMFEYASSSGEHRVGEIINENTIGLFMANAILSCFTILFYNKSGLKKTLLIVLFVIFGIMLLLSGSKKATAFMFVGVVVLLIYNTRNQNLIKKIIWATVIIAFVLLFLYAINNLAIFGTIKLRFEQLFNAIIGDGDTAQTDESRFEMIEEGLNAFLMSPLFGNGTGYSYKLFGTYSHNNFIELLMNYGIIGFLIYYIPYLLLIPKLWRLAKEKDFYAIYFLVYIVMQIILGIGWVNYYDRIVQLITASAWGYVSVKALKGGRNETNQHI